MGNFESIYKHNNQQMSLRRISGQLMKIVLAAICFLKQAEKEKEHWIWNQKT